MGIRTNASRFLALGSILAGTAVAAGAFGAHMLKGMLDTSMLAVYDTATRYQMYHALALCIVSRAIARKPESGLEIVGWLFCIGTLIFCGSLYALSVTGFKWFGAVTPLGGVAFIAGWVVLTVRVWQGRVDEDISREAS